MPREFKLILAPIDFSDSSYHALEYALRFAKSSDGTLLMPHVLHNPMSDEFRTGGHSIPFTDAQAKSAERLEEVWKEKLGSYPKCERLIVIGDPYTEIVSIANEKKADLIIISTHGRTGLQHLMIGSVAEKVVRHAPCPVFVVRRGVE